MGPPYDYVKEDLVSELHSLFIDDLQHTLIGGDLNLVIYQHDKSSGKIDHCWSDRFNV